MEKSQIPQRHELILELEEALRLENTGDSYLGRHIFQAYKQTKKHLQMVHAALERILFTDALTEGEPAMEGHRKNLERQISETYQYVHETKLPIFYGHLQRLKQTDSLLILVALVSSFF